MCLIRSHGLISMDWDFSALRQYLGQRPRDNRDALVMDATVYREPGAVMLLSFLLQLRVNRRSRRSMDSVYAASALQVKPRWFTVLAQQLWNLYRLALNQTFYADVSLSEMNITMTYIVLKKEI